jgi:callose synthase
LTLVLLEPLFVPVGLDLAVAALWILAINASLVGMSLGVMLPTLLPGISLGVSIVLLAGCFLGVANPLYLPVVGGSCALIGAVLSAR